VSSTTSNIPLTAWQLRKLPVLLQALLGFFLARLFSVQMVAPDQTFGSICWAVRLKNALGYPERPLLGASNASKQEEHKSAPQEKRQQLAAPNKPCSHGHLQHDSAS
jgi:hypothetical protein